MSMTDEKNLAVSLSPQARARIAPLGRAQTRPSSASTSPGSTTVRGLRPAPGRRTPLSADHCRPPALRRPWAP
jgi:hypothetical protein